MPKTSPKRRGFMFILSSPSGAGKTTLSRLLLKEEKHLVISISVTTRPKRPAEEEGVHYYFVTPEEFDDMIDNDEFIEYAEVFQARYGTPRHKIEALLAGGHDVLFDIDWQGMGELTRQARQDVVSIFILPPSMEELEKRLIGRGQDSEAVIAHRMKKAAAEISHWHEYDYAVVNEDITQSLAEIRAILHVERLKSARQAGLKDLVEEMIGE